MKTVLLLAVVAGGCATASPSWKSTTSATDAGLAEAVRVCAWGNGSACSELERRLSDLSRFGSSARAVALTGLVREAAHRNDRFAAMIDRCRGGDSRPCDDAAQTLAQIAAGAAPDDLLAEAVLDSIDPEPYKFPPAGVLTSR